MYIKGRLTMEKTGDDMQKPTELSASTLPLSITFYSLSLVFAALAMMTKEIAFTLPVMILLYEVAFFRSSLRRRLLFLIPIALILIIVFIGVFVSDKSLEDMLSDAGEIARVQTHMSRWDYLNTQMRVITTYIRLIFLPVNQNFDYDYPIEHSFFTLPVFFSFLFLLALFGLALYLFSRSRFIAFGILWFFITLSVESSIIPIIDVIFEHRVYLPSIGLLTGITTGVFIVSHRLKMERIGLSVLVLVVLILSGATYARNTVWMSKVSLWEDVVSKSPDKARPRNNLGVFYYEAGYLDKAGREFQAALKINPGYPDAHYNLGNIHLASGRIDEALREFQTAVKLKPDYADAHNNLGTLYARRGNFEEALREFQTALQIDAKNPARKNLEKLLEMQQTKGGAP
jgi:tetratricopeptide (TPR) repeat protein